MLNESAQRIVAADITDAAEHVVLCGTEWPPHQGLKVPCLRHAASLAGIIAMPRMALLLCLAGLLMSECLLSTEGRAIPAGRMLQQGLVSGVTQPVVGGAIYSALIAVCCATVDCSLVSLRRCEV